MEFQKITIEKQPADPEGHGYTVKFQANGNEYEYRAFTLGENPAIITLKTVEPVNTANSLNSCHGYKNRPTFSTFWEMTENADLYKWATEKARDWNDPAELADNLYNELVEVLASYSAHGFFAPLIRIYIADALAEVDFLTIARFFINGKKSEAELEAKAKHQKGKRG